MEVKRLLLEVSIASPDDAKIAETNGADRLELCAALSLGGLSPSCGLIESVRQVTRLPLMVLIRPRPSGFHYSDAEFDVMCRDIEALPESVEGVVFGVLEATGAIDLKRCAKLRELAGKRQAVFHRAFDVVPNPLEGLEQVISLGFQRVMTSGQMPTATIGTPLIQRLIDRARGRIEVLPAGGINAENVADLVKRTGCEQIHGSFRASKTDPSTAARPKVRFGKEDEAGEGRYDVVDGAAVKKVRAILDEIAKPPPAPDAPK